MTAPYLPKEQYAEALIPLALRLVGAVHDEGPDDVRGALAALAALPAPPDVNPGQAVAVALAAMVDPTKRKSDLLGWITRLAAPAGPDLGTEADRNALAVEMGLSGCLPAHALTEREAAAVVTELLNRRWREDEIRDHLRADRRDVERWCNAARARAKRAAAAAENEAA